MAEPILGKQVLRDRMRAALLELQKAKTSMFSATVELRSQAFNDEADDLQAVIDDLDTQYAAIVQAIEDNEAGVLPPPPSDP